jgi:hypothetical protein
MLLPKLVIIYTSLLSSILKLISGISAKTGAELSTLFTRL